MMNTNVFSHQDDSDDLVLIIEPGRADKNYWADLWRYRDLFLILAWRDVAVQYKQTAIGIAWAIIKPVLTIIIFTVIFGRLAHLPSDGSTPYPLLVFSGLLPWTLFASCLSEASNSLLGNEKLISKVYFPRLIVPAATMMTPLIDFLISFVLFLMLMIFYRFPPSWHILFVPVLVLLVLLASLGPGLWLTAMNVKFRDFRYIIPFIIQFGLYISPVGFSGSVVPQEWRMIYSLNPMAGLIDAFRWACLGGQSPLYLPGFLLSITVILLLLGLGIYQFRKMEKTFADLI